LLVTQSFDHDNAITLLHTQLALSTVFIHKVSAVYID
jgi:hypothetical protein